MIKYLLFDVSETLLYKPRLIPIISEVLNSFGHSIPDEELRFKHKLLSEIFDFPDRTDHIFYRKFNSALLILIGIIPEDKILDKIFKKCTYLEWQKYDDTAFLQTLDLPMGIISNFNTSLKEKLNFFFGERFLNIFVSEEVGISKPDINFYNHAINALNYNPDQILYIGDSMKLDVQPAKKLGLKTLLIDRNNFYAKNEFIINNLQEITNFI